MFSRKTVLIIVLCLLGLGALYWLSTYYAAYTDDAYVTTDVIRVAPEVSGCVDKVHVKDNQKVNKGELLISLDPTPFQLDLAVNQARLEKEKAGLRSRQEAVRIASGKVATAKAKLKLAQELVKHNRIATRQGAVSRAHFEELLGDLGTAVGAVTSANASLEMSKRQVAESQASIRVCQAQVNLSRYRLQRVNIYAPSPGHVASLRIHKGDYAFKGKPIIALVADDAWRVEANYREQFLRHIRPGQRVWLRLDGHPWRIIKGTVQGIRKAVSRQPTRDELLPYVEPTTNWIRLSRRFPVRITLDNPPKDLTLHMGADARTLVIY